MGTDKKETTALAMPINYQTVEKPASLKLKEGEWYLISNGNYGTRKVKILSIRNISGDYVVYYKWISRSSGIFGFTKVWSFDNTTLDAFKQQLLDYGKVSYVDIVHPEMKA